MKNIPYHLFKLSNGLQVVFYPLKNIKAVALELYIKAGSWQETKEKRGIYHFLEHLIRQGSKKYPTPFRIAFEEEKLGILSGSIVSGEVTSFRLRAPRQNFAKALNLFVELLFNPLFKKESVEKERKVILQEYFDFWDSPRNRFSAKVLQKFFGENHPYTFRPLGTKESIENIDKKDLVKCHIKHYLTSNMVLGIVGDLKPELVENKLKISFGKIGFRKPPKQPKIPKVRYKKQSLFVPEKVEQITLSLGFPAPGWKEKPRKEITITFMLNAILGGLKSSRLFLKLREEQALVYSIFSRYNSFPLEGVISVTTSCSAKNFKTVYNSIISEIKRLKTKGISQKEFKLAKKFLLYQNAMQFDSVNRIANWLTTELLRMKEIWLPEDYHHLVTKIAKSELEAQIKRIFDFKKATIGIMGPKTLSKQAPEILKSI